MCVSRTQMPNTSLSNIPVTQSDKVTSQAPNQKNILQRIWTAFSQAIKWIFGCIASLFCCFNRKVQVITPVKAVEPPQVPLGRFSGIAGLNVMGREVEYYKVLAATFCHRLWDALATGKNPPSQGEIEEMINQSIREGNAIRPLSQSNALIRPDHFSRMREHPEFHNAPFGQPATDYSILNPVIGSKQMVAAMRTGPNGEADGLLIDTRSGRTPRFYCYDPRQNPATLSIHGDAAGFIAHLRQTLPGEFALEPFIIAT